MLSLTSSNKLICLICQSPLPTILPIKPSPLSTILHSDAQVLRSTGDICLTGWKCCIHLKRERAVTAPLGSASPAYPGGAARHAAPETVVELTPGVLDLASLPPRQDVPEEVRKPSTAAVDAWAFGFLVCKLLSGSEPFSETAAARDAAAGQHPLLRATLSLPGALGRLEKDLIERCLQLGPAERLGMAEVLEHPLALKYVSSNQR